MINNDVEEGTTIWLAHRNSVEPEPYKFYLKSFAYKTKEEAIKAFIDREQEYIRKAMETIVSANNNIANVNKTCS